MPVNYQVSADNGYSTDKNTTYLEEKGLYWYISTRKLSRKKVQQVGKTILKR